jgi:hypothetical protein
MTKDHTIGSPEPTLAKPAERSSRKLQIPPDWIKEPYELGKTITIIGYSGPRPKKPNAGPRPKKSEHE